MSGTQVSGAVLGQEGLLGTGGGGGSLALKATCFFLKNFPGSSHSEKSSLLNVSALLDQKEGVSNSSKILFLCMLY